MGVNIYDHSVPQDQWAILIGGAGTGWLPWAMTPVGTLTVLHLD